MYKSLLHILSAFLEFLSITIIIVGVLLQYISFLKVQFTSSNPRSKVEYITDLKNFLGTYILFSLEILIAADIIESILDPSLSHILSLAAIVIIRTIISYFLNKEIKDS